MNEYKNQIFSLENDNTNIFSLFPFHLISLTVHLPGLPKLSTIKYLYNFSKEEKVFQEKFFNWYVSDPNGGLNLSNIKEHFLSQPFFFEIFTLLL